MKYPYFLIVLLLLSFPGFALAEEISFLKYCNFLEVDADELTKDEKAITISCVAYVKGVLDTHSTLSMGKNIKPLYCKPARVTYGDVGRMYADYARDNPPKPNINEAEALMEALKKAYPCR